MYIIFNVDKEALMINVEIAQNDNFNTAVIHYPRVIISLL